MNPDILPTTYSNPVGPRPRDAVIISLATQREYRAQRQRVQRLATLLLQQLRIPRYDNALVPWLTDDMHCHDNAIALRHWVQQELPRHGYTDPSDEDRVRNELAERLGALLRIVEGGTC